MNVVLKSKILLRKQFLIDWKIVENEIFSTDVRTEISRLWLQDAFSNPFCSPSYLEMMVKKAVQRSEVPVFAKGYDSSGNLAALWTFRLDRKKRLFFLPFFLSDYNTALYMPWVDEDFLAGGVTATVQQIRPKTILLDGMPDWGLTRTAAVRGIQQARYRCQAVLYDKVPCVRGADDSEGKARFSRQFNKHRGLKNYTNRIQREKGFFFEVDDSPDQMGEWVDQFCEAHDKRWDPTGTPSKYQDEAARNDLKDALTAWARDRVLIRFCIQVLNRRITFVVGLKNKKSRDLIYFHTARLPVYNKLSTGNITIRLMGLWMMDNGYTCLDFGRGNEAYKHFFANDVQNLWRVYGAGSVVSALYWKGCIEAYVKGKESRRQMWAMLDKHVFKSRWMKVFRRE